MVRQPVKGCKVGIWDESGDFIKKIDFTDPDTFNLILKYHRPKLVSVGTYLTEAVCEGDGQDWPCPAYKKFRKYVQDGGINNPPAQPEAKPRIPNTKNT